MNHSPMGQRSSRQIPDRSSASLTFNGHYHFGTLQPSQCSVPITPFFETAVVRTTKLSAPRRRVRLCTSMAGCIQPEDFKCPKIKKIETVVHPSGKVKAAFLASRLTDGSVTATGDTMKRGASIAGPNKAQHLHARCMQETSSHLLHACTLSRNILLVCSCSRQHLLINSRVLDFSILFICR